MTSGYTVRESVFVETTARRAYEVVSDVTRMGEWSPENTGAVVLGGVSMSPGTRFRGTNRSGWFRWSTRCEVVHAEPA